VDPKNVRRAWHCFEAFANAKHEVHRLDDALTTMKQGADAGLENVELLDHAISGTFDRADLVTLGFKAVNGAARVDSSLRSRRPWRWWHR
jgi:hypothetical protein